jgi:hypothetical protein
MSAKFVEIESFSDAFFCVWCLFHFWRKNREYENMIRNWFKSNRFSQCVTHVWRRFVMNIKSIVLIEFFVFQMMMFCNKQNCMCVVLKSSINWSITTCCVKRIEFDYNEWCKLKFFSKTCFASSFRKRFIVFNDEKSSFDEYEIDDAL